MVMLVIGALLIGYLVYFAMGLWMLRQKQRGVPPVADADFDPHPNDDHVARLEARIAVLEQIIAENPPPPSEERGEHRP